MTPAPPTALHTLRPTTSLFSPSSYSQKSPYHFDTLFPYTAPTSEADGLPGNPTWFPQYMESNGGGHGQSQTAQFPLYVGEFEIGLELTPTIDENGL